MFMTLTIASTILNKVKKQLIAIITFLGNGQDKRIITLLLLHSPDTSQNARKLKFVSDIIIYITHTTGNRNIREYSVSVVQVIVLLKIRVDRLRPCKEKLKR